MEIAKLRAARMLWANIVKDYNPKCDCAPSCECEEEIVDDISIGLSSLRFEQKLKEKYLQLKNILYGFMDALLVLSDKRDPYTGGHQRRVALISSKIAKELNLSEERIEGLYITSLLHDIGKICVPLSLLSKPGKLSEHEYGVIQGHCLEAYDILKNIEFPWPVAQIILQHHEREDGSGYPNGLKNGQILLHDPPSCVFPDGNESGWHPHCGPLGGR
jgi:HD-GYP domain-containing protein (c-di-GMP phosphodiesterase class II)